ncbi:hypothetical protein G6F36_010048 [Rhizopus arrhizus]|nr:hypothetical protein G6F36_010048 [Rhizopus arrhizus]
MDKTAIKKNRHDVYWQQFNHWFDSLIGHSQQQPTLPLNQQQQQQQKKRWLRLSVLFYVVFSILLTSAHCTSWFFRFLSQNTKDDFVFERTYDADLSYSSLTDMSHGLRLSKMFPKGEYHALNGVSPFWQSASQPAQDDEVTLLTTISAESWKELVALAENWNEKITFLK